MLSGNNCGYLHFRKYADETGNYQSAQPVKWVNINYTNWKTYKDARAESANCMDGRQENQAPGPIGNLRCGRLIRILTVVFFVAGVIVIMAISETMDFSRSIEKLVGKVSILGLLSVFFLIYNYSRRFDARSGAEVMADDPRPPVIYLLWTGYLK